MKIICKICIYFSALIKEYDKNIEDTKRNTIKA
jgi:hypothetical protein